MAIKLLITFFLGIKCAWCFYASPILTYQVFSHRDRIRISKEALNKAERKLYQEILTDRQKRISSEFHYGRFLKKRVEFWLLIYAFYDRNTLVFHEKEDLGNILATYRLIIPEDIDPIERMMINHHYQLKLTKLVKKTNPLIFRVQSGRKEEFTKGLGRYAGHYYFHKKQLKTFELPEEIMALGFLESNYNPKAVSFANAGGIWQIMPFLAKTLMPFSKENDTRFNPFISTLAAFHLLKQNRKILKRWDLAITSYNNGMKAILGTRKKLNMPLEQMSLELFVNHNSDLSVGFASSNFFSTFTALAYALAYKEKLYAWNPPLESKSIKIGVLQCGQSENYAFESELNPQFKNSPSAKSIIVTKDSNKSGLILLSPEQLRRKYPLNWHKWFKLGC